MCPQVSRGRVSPAVGSGPEGVRAAAQRPLEVLQQAQDALLLALPELRAAAVPDVLCIL